MKLKQQPKTTNHSFESEWQKRFKDFASANDDDAGIAGWSTSGLQLRVQHFAKIWSGDKAGALWLDAGCGAGTYSRFLSSHQLNVIGLDYNFPSIVKAKSREATTIHWGVANVKQLPLPPHSVDGILCFGVLQALASSRPAIQELSNIVKPGGQIWVDALNIWCLPHLWGWLVRKLKGKKPHLRYESPWALMRVLKDCGLVNIKMYWLPMVPQRLQTFQRLVNNPVTRAILKIMPPLGALLSHSFTVSGQLPHNHQTNTRK